VYELAVKAVSDTAVLATVASGTVVWKVSKEADT
jgi:hypothetical protein